MAHQMHMMVDSSGTPNMVAKLSVIISQTK